MLKTDNNHKMYINADGERVMRITEIISVLAKDQLATWANMIGLQGIKYRDELDRTANIGTMMHAVMEAYHTPGELAVFDFAEFGIYDYKSQQEARNILMSIFKWMKDVQSWFHVVFVEKVVIGKKYGGTIDCGIKGRKDPKKVIFVDYKSSKDFFASQFIQLGGYVRVYEEVNGPDSVEGVMVIHADKKHGKKAKAFFIPRENMEPFMICFDCLYNTAVATKMLNVHWREFGEEVK